MLCFVGLVASADTIDRASPYFSEGALLLREVLPGQGVEIPETLYPRDDLEARWQEADANPELRNASAKAEDKAARYLHIADAQWIELLPDRSTSPRYANGDDKTCEHCPLTGASAFYTYLDWESLDLETNPRRIRSKFSERWICERQEDVTAADGQTVDGYDEIPHWDGPTRRVAYTLSKVLADSDGQPAKYYPANIVWHARLRAICYKAVPALHDAYFATGDDTYAAKLVVILTRLADMMPAMPMAKWRGLEVLSVTREEFLAAPRPRIFGPTPWHWSIVGGPARIMPDYTNIADDGGVAGHLAKAYLLIEESPAWGEGEAGDERRERIKQGLFNELGLMLSACGTQVGNHAMGYVESLLALGIILQDRHFLGRYNQFLEDWLYNQNHYDAISTEGSAGYSMMMDGMTDVWARMRGRYEPDYLEKHPFLQHVGRTRERMITLRGKHSEHGDAFERLSQTVAGRDGG